MIRRRIGYAVCLLLAACLYFFENNTGTRAVLVCAALIPFIPPLRRAFLSPDAPGKGKARETLTVRAFVRQEPEETGGIRPYVPGDPVRLIHWKLSAKKDELLVREPEKEADAKEEERTVSRAGRRPEKRFRHPAAWIAAGIVLCAAMLLLVPEARSGAQALCNRLFAASEAVNAYAYRYFPVPENQSAVLASCLLLCAAGLLMSLAVTVRNGLPALGILAACTLFQVYFGLSFPAWINIPLYGLLAVGMMGRPVRRKAVAAFCALLVLASLAVVLILPGTDAATEAASESVRDRLARMAEQMAGTVQETPEGETETRHIHTRSLETGDLEAATEREFLPVTVEEEQVSLPHWTNWMRVILLMILSVAVIALPFAPFVLLNARKKKAREARKAFGSPDVREAVQAIFRQVILWLETAKQGAGNRLYRDWAGSLPEGLPDHYAQRFARCAADYEESVYSDHAMTEEQRRNALDLLEETETSIWKTADWKQRFTLKYWMCLHE